MLTLTTEQKHALAKALDHVMYTERWSAPVEISNGVTVRVKAVADNETRLEDTDCFGTLHWPERDSRARPAGCDGAARKVQTRSGYVWWQPPSDVLGDAKVLESLHERVQAYFLEHWTYVGVVVQVTFPACTCCGERKHKEASVWGIESDAGDYFAQVIQDLAQEQAWCSRDDTCKAGVWFDGYDWMPGCKPKKERLNERSAKDILRGAVRVARHEGAITKAEAEKALVALEDREHAV